MTLVSKRTDTKLASKKRPRVVGPKKKRVAVKKRSR
jgi:hypothetical protein